MGNKKQTQVCNDCCDDLGLDINSFIISRCHRKYCDICHYSSNSDLSIFTDKEVEIKLEEKADHEEEC